MKQIKSIEEYNNLTKEAQLNGLKNLNCFLLPNEVECLIKDEQLFYINDENTLQFIVVKDRYNKVCFFGNDDFVFFKVSNNNPSITDMPYNRILTDKNLALKEKLENLGFQLNSISSRNCCRNLDVKINEYEGYTIELLNDNEIDVIYDMWEENFDFLENLLYSKQEIKACENPIYVLKDKFNNIVGGMELVINSSFGLVQRIAVSKKHQGKGLGSILEKFYINKCKELGLKMLLLYTIDSNLNAQKFHAKFGFIPDGRKNYQFLFKE